MKKILFTLTLLLLSFVAEAQIYSFPVHVGNTSAGEFSINTQTWQWRWTKFDTNWYPFYSADITTIYIHLSQVKGKKPPTPTKIADFAKNNTPISDFITIDMAPGKYIICICMNNMLIEMTSPMTSATDKAFINLSNSLKKSNKSNSDISSSKVSATTKVNQGNGNSTRQNTQRSGSTKHSGHFNADAVVDSAQVGYSWDDSQDYSNENSQDDWAIDSLKVFYEMQKQESSEFLRQNAKKPGVITLPSGLQYKVLRKGSGPIATANDMVEMNYDGRFIDGSSFDNNGSQTVTSEVATLIKGLEEAITKMSEGSIWEIYVPYDLGFGERDLGLIPPFSTLIYKVEIVKVIKN